LGAVEAFRNVVLEFRKGARLADQVYRNPFVVMAVNGSGVARQLFKEMLQFAALFSTKEARFLVCKLRDGIDFEQTCQAIEASQGSVLVDSRDSSL
jgi:hypothetical protein